MLISKLVSLGLSKRALQHRKTGVNTREVLTAFTIKIHYSADTALNKASSNYRLFHMMMLREKKKFSKYIFRARRLSQVKVWESEKRNYLELQEVFALSL